MEREPCRTVLVQTGDLIVQNGCGGSGRGVNHAERGSCEHERRVAENRYRFDKPWNFGNASACIFTMALAGPAPLSCVRKHNFLFLDSFRRIFGLENGKFVRAAFWILVPASHSKISFCFISFRFSVVADFARKLHWMRRFLILKRCNLRFFQNCPPWTQNLLAFFSVL